MTTILQQPSAARDAHADAARVEADWKPMYRMGGMAALISIAAIVIAVPIYLISPPPTTVLDWFTLFHQNAFVGLLDLDLLMLIGIAMSGLIYIALFFASNTAFNMLALSGQYDAATTDAERSQLLAAGQATLAIWQGSSYDI